MSKIIKHKRSSTAGNRPDQSQIEIGELAINFADRTIYTKDTSNVVTSIGQDIWRSASAPDSAREGDIWYNTTDGSYSFWDGAGPSWKTLDSSVEDVVSSSSSITDRLDSDHGWANTYFDQINSRLDSEHGYAATTGVDIRRDASSPSGAVEGDIWYDTTDGKYNLWNGAGPVWKSLDSTIDSAISASSGSSSGGSGFELVQTLETFTSGIAVSNFEFTLDPTTYRVYRFVVDLGPAGSNADLAMQVGSSGSYDTSVNYRSNGLNAQNNNNTFWEGQSDQWFLTGNSGGEYKFQYAANFQIILSGLQSQELGNPTGYYKPTARWIGAGSTSSMDVFYYSGAGMLNSTRIGTGVGIDKVKIFTKSSAQFTGAITLEGMRI